MPFEIGGRVRLERRFRAARVSVGVALTALVLVGCDAGGEQGGVPLRAATLEPVRTLELEEADSAYVGQIFSHATMEFGPSGQLLIGDRFTSRILLFDSTGVLLRVAGREGQGPGEYRHIWAVGWESRDRVWVIDAERTTRLDAEFQVAETEPSLGDPYSRSVQFSADRSFIGRYHSFNEGDAIGIRSKSGGEKLGSLLPFSPLGREPYVRSFYRPVFRVVGDTIIGGSTLAYPLKVMDLDGALLAEFGSPPPSTGEMRVPTVGEFATDMLAGDRWRRSFGMTSSIWIAHDSLVVVEHQRPHPEPGGYPAATYRIDVYHRWSLEKLVEDLELPGPIMDWHDGLLWILTDMPPGPWTFTGFRVVVE